MSVTVGEWESLEELYRASRDDVYGYVLSLLSDHGAAEDVTAQAFEKAYRNRRSFDARRGGQRAWLFGIARNAALDELRRRRRHVALYVEPETLASEVEDDGEVLLRRTTVRSALEELPARERELIALKFHAGLNNREIAAVLGVTESNAGTLLHRTITKLRETVNATA